MLYMWLNPHENDFLLSLTLTIELMYPNLGQADLDNLTIDVP